MCELLLTHLKYSQYTHASPTEGFTVLISTFPSQRADIVFAPVFTPGSNGPECKHCKDDLKKNCRWCNCHVCGVKQDPDKQLLCDECDMAFHIYCLNPPLTSLPEDDDWSVNYSTDVCAGSLFVWPVPPSRAAYVTVLVMPLIQMALEACF